jgi:xanthine dehydrogenase accessory factor
MLFGDRLVVVRGGGDLATGAVAQLHRAGFPVVVLELAQPAAVRRTVAFASAVIEGEVTVDGIVARRAGTAQDALNLTANGEVAVLVSPTIPVIARPVSVLIDGRMAKRNIDTARDQSPFVVALGPGFVAGSDCDAVIETRRGHRLGRVIWEGCAAPNTGVPGAVGGASRDRLVRAPRGGNIDWTVQIGDTVEVGQSLGIVGGAQIPASIGGVVRGLIAPGHEVATGMKIGDVDPRSERSACFEISDKSRLVGAGVLEAVLVWLNRGEA